MPTHEAKKRVDTWVGADGHALPFTAMQDGAAYSLTGLTLTLSATYADAQKIDGAAVTVTDEAAGEFEYTPTAAEVNVPGEYNGQVKIVNGSGKVDYLEPVIINVRQPITPSA